MIAVGVSCNWIIGDESTLEVQFIWNKIDGGSEYFSEFEIEVLIDGKIESQNVLTEIKVQLAIFVDKLDGLA